MSSIPVALKRFLFTSPAPALAPVPASAPAPACTPASSDTPPPPPPPPQPDSLLVHVPEYLGASYSLYTWPCAPVLAWFLWDQRHHIKDKTILEIGSGIVAAKCGARVTLSDSCTLPRTLANIAHCCEVNGLTPGLDVRVVGLTWGLFLDDVFELGPFDLIIGSDCFYDPSVFEDVIVTVAFFLEKNDAKFLCTYQERSSDWTIEPILKKWNLKCDVIDLGSVGDSSGVDFAELMGGHSIHLLEISSDYQ